APDDHLGVERHERRRRVGRAHRHATVGPENGVLAVDGLRRIRVADVAAGPVARPAGPVVPAARVLRYVAADGALVANLRRGRRLGGLGQDAEALLHRRMPHDAGQRGHRAALETIAAGTNALHRADAAEVDDARRPLDAVLEPVE